jgi:tRNA (cytidine/uridine-2'-O-)-methyltransferase
LRLRRVPPGAGRRGAAPLVRVSAEGPSSLYSTRFRPKDVLVFGRESTGLPAEIRALFPPEATLRIPMQPRVRSLNLSNAVAVADVRSLATARLRRFG